MGSMHLPELPPTVGRVLALDLGAASPVAWLAVLLAVGYGVGLWRLERRGVGWAMLGAVYWVGGWAGGVFGGRCCARSPGWPAARRSSTSPPAGCSPTAWACSACT